MGRKNNRSRISSTVWFLIVMFIFAMTLLNGVETNNDRIFWGVIFIGIFLVNIKLGFWFYKYYTIPHSYHIIEYERWDKSTEKYVKVYDFYEAFEYEKYFLFFKIGDYYENFDLKKITKYLNNNSNHGDYYKTKEEVMKKIMDRVSQFISISKEENNEIILNIQEKDVLLYSELVKRKRND